MTDKNQPSEHVKIIRDLMDFIDSEETEYKLAYDSRLRFRADKVLDAEHFDKLPRAKSDGAAVIIMSRGQWGKGRTIHEAASNHPADLTRVGAAKKYDVIVTVFSWREGDPLFEESTSAYNSIGVDGMGRIHYPRAFGSHELNTELVPLSRLFTDAAVKPK